MTDIPDYIIRELENNPRIGREGLAKKCHISEFDARIYCREFKGRLDNRKLVKKLLAGGDTHSPHEDAYAMKIFRDFAEDFQPDIFVYTGDIIDLDTISIHNKGKAKLLEKRRLIDDYVHTQDLLDYIEAPLPEDCKKYFIVGNHEMRAQWLIRDQPQWEGYAEVENNLDLDRYTVIPFNHALPLGEMVLLHGVYWNKFHAAKNLGKWSQNVFTWHVHTNQVYTGESPLNKLPRQAVSVGCLCDKAPEYKKDAPTAWVNQFLFAYLYDDGSFTYYTPIIINGRCTINDKLYLGEE